MLPTFVIGLREGLEAALIVGIIAAFLLRRGERSALRWMWAGVGLAVVLCLGIALVFRAIDRVAPPPRPGDPGGDHGARWRSPASPT